MSMRHIREGIVQLSLCPRCEICGVEHEPGEPHDPYSFFYQVMFWREHGRWPTWDDAMAHCDEQTKREWRIMLHSAAWQVGMGTWDFGEDSL